MNKDVSNWASERLHDILGFSDRNLSDYLVSLASKASSAADLCEKLYANDVPRGGSTERFCDELFGKCHGVLGAPAIKSARSASYSQSNAALLRKSAKYQMVDSDDDEEERQKCGSKSKNTNKEKKERKKGKEKEKKKRNRDREKAQSREDESSEEEPTVIRRAGDNTREDDEEGDDEGAKKAQMDADIAERDAFVSRLLDKEAARTKTNKAVKIKEEDDGGEAKSKKARKGGVGEVDDPSAVDMLREASRQSYLEKREEKELRLLEMSLRDEEELFAGQKLSAEEEARRDVNKRVLAMAKNKYRFDVKDDGYALPQSYEDESSGLLDKSKRDAALNGRYVEEDRIKSEQEMWEEQLTSKSKLRRAHGAGEAQYSTEDKNYDLVMEDSIEFLSLEMLKGTRTEEDDLREAQELEAERQAAAVAAREAAERSKTQLTAHQKMLEGRKKLPVYSYRDQFLAAVRDHKVLIVVGETGSGKTTQIPQYLHEGGWSEIGKIGCTQPRRVAAMSVAARVAQEMGVKLGNEVGYAIRFEDCTNEKTCIKYMTDGMLLREFLTEPDLAGYSCMMIDEAHERTLHTDVLFGLVKDISRFRGDDFRLIISSATLDAEKFSAYFDDAPKFIIPGRMFHVDIMYTKAPEADYLDAAVVTVLQVHVTQDLPGDILVFFTGQEEIETCVEILQLRLRGLGSRVPALNICPVYANLPSDMQSKIFEPTLPGQRKVVLGTNIAETSLTIDGICYVIDIGFCKQKSYNPKTGMESLVVTPISQAAANQRAGRAGRTQPGKCFRLFTAWSFHNELEPNTTPEIQRTNMGNVVLMLKSLGIDDLLHFDFMDRPPAETLMRALEQLYALGALNDRGEMTKLGRRMAEFPLDPMMSKAVIASEQYGCTKEVLTIVSMLSIGSSIFYRPKEKAVHADNARMNFARGGGGDHLALMRVYDQWLETGHSVQWCFENYLQHRLLYKARDVREQLYGLCERVEIDAEVSTSDPEAICKAITAGYFYNTARLDRTGGYKTTKQQHTVYIHPSSVLTPRIAKPEGGESKEQEQQRREAEEKAIENLPKWILFHELAFTTKEYMRQCCPIRGSWLVEIAPHYYQSSDVSDAQGGRMPNRKGQAKAA